MPEHVIGLNEIDIKLCKKVGIWEGFRCNKVHLKTG